MAKASIAAYPFRNLRSTSLVVQLPKRSQIQTFSIAPDITAVLKILHENAGDPLWPMPHGHPIDSAFQGDGPGAAGGNCGEVALVIMRAISLRLMADQITGEVVENRH